MHARMPVHGRIRGKCTCTNRPSINLWCISQLLVKVFAPVGGLGALACMRAGVTKG